MFCCYPLCVLAPSRPSPHNPSASPLLRPELQRQLQLEDLAVFLSTDEAAVAAAGPKEASRIAAAVPGAFLCRMPRLMVADS